MADGTDDQASNATQRIRRRAQTAREEVEGRIHDVEERIHDIEARAREMDARIEKRVGRNLPKALFFGLVLGLSLLFSLIFVTELFMLFGAALVVFTSYELASALRFAGRDVPRIPVVVASLGVIAPAYYFGAVGLWAAFLAGVALVTVWRLVEQLRPSLRNDPAVSLPTDLAAGIFVLAYVSLLGGFAVVMTATDGGEWWTLAYLIIVICIDIGAYASGLAFGKTPMAPRISPKKTWEGFAGAVAVALIAGVLLALFMLGQPWWVGLILAAAMVVTATVGDLTESLVKRDLGIKDISTWLPGHGGFLDRLDSILPSTVAAYLVFLAFGVA
ncbi:phosphatidate cytidylyltransferase [Microcella putealis]|uniref:Phosphatidate cytidylyltransferase n=1 Tax=Microcella putealis TaxID=337005 RepID=A0A4Q7LRX3_9MICO|nr:phosphatidate cytidylyltransferase [Microcella putealis]RZS57586.1 phosphatidate cytidylyltransferase [Microcella putealis]TQM24653.1 phosphatidate cytidylyltransferase [Microcella putealis]